ncbi:MAG: hypothetical protein H6838_09755 [Planctomycetes bacterium]|nr:hypothetical protein [Planctomycetota bacterium]MCB9885767.1 hypothetical protein [Planctomycetota bacterium]
MLRSHLLHLSGLLLAGLSPLAAQSWETPPATAPASTAPQADQGDLTAARSPAATFAALRTPIHTADADLGNAYGTWAAGDSYKASFHDGMTFVPYLGADYPHNQPLSWRTTSVRIGELELLGAAAPEHHHDDYRYEYRSGAVVEAYDVRAEGLEQTFVISQRPAAGDLVVTGMVTTALRVANVAAAPQALTFADAEGRALVGYGRAVAFDAAGARVEVTTAHEGGRVTLTVPASWVARAALPITIDPLLTRVTVANGTGSPVGDVDICRHHESAPANVMLAYSRNASALDGDIWLRLCSDDCSTSSLVFTDITSTWHSDRPAVTFVGGRNRWALVLRRYFVNNVVRASQLRFHVHDMNDTALSTTYSAISPPANGNDWRPDIGGVEGYQLGDNAMIVFQREDNAATAGDFANTDYSGVYGAVLDLTTANGSIGAAFPIYAPVNSDTERPRVNKLMRGNNPRSWLCVFQTYDNTINNDDWDIGARFASDAGTVSAGLWVSSRAGLNLEHKLGPVIDGNQGRYVVSYAVTDVATTPFKTTLINGKQLYTERIDWWSAGSPTNHPANLIRSNTDRRWETGCLAYDNFNAEHWALGFRAVSPGVPAAYYTRLGSHGLPLDGAQGALLYYVSGETPTSMACTMDVENDDYIFAFGVDDGAAEPLYAQRLAYPTPAPVTSYGQACSPVTLGWSGSRLIGDSQNLLQASNGNPGDLHLAVMSLASSNFMILDPAVPLGCRLLVDIGQPNYLGILPFRVGTTANWFIGFPEWLDSMTLYFQDVVFDGSYFRGSQGLAVPIVK